MIWRASLLALGWWACCGCAETTPTQVIVQLYVEDELAKTATQLHVSIENDDKKIVFTKDTELDGAPGRVSRIPLIPKGGDPTRRYVVHAELSDGTNVIGRIEARSGYVDGELRTLNLWFTNACSQKMDCEEGRTCDRGTCRGSCFVTSPVDTTSPSRPSCKECQKCLVGCEATDKAPCGCTGDECAGSECNPERKVRYVGAGTTHTCAVLADDMVYCWGTIGELSLSSATPTATGVPGSSGVSVGEHGCALSESKPGAPPSRTCWGANLSGQLGDGTFTSGLVTVTTDDPQLRVVDVGRHHTCGWSQSGQIACWGDNTAGQVGNGTFTNAPTPVLFAGTDYAQVVAGGDQSCGLEKGGNLRCWGQNYSGQVGVKDRIQFATPVEPGCDDPTSPTCFHDWTYVGAGDWVTCGIRDGGKLYCWGSHEYGGLGIGPSYKNVEISEPTRVGAGIEWLKVAGGYRHTCGIDANTRLYCWGLNDHHESSQSDDDPVPVPTLVETDTSDGVEKLSLGKTHTCALREDQTLWCWGDNTSGQVGGANEVVERPTRVCF